MTRLSNRLDSSADANDVLEVVTDLTRLPEWAPGFVDHVTGNDVTGWTAAKDGREFVLRILQGQDGAVALVREHGDGHVDGAQLRVLSRPGGGSSVVITLANVPGAELARTSETLLYELRALVTLAGSRALPDARNELSSVTE